MRAWFLATGCFAILVAGAGRGAAEEAPAVAPGVATLRAVYRAAGIATRPDAAAWSGAPTLKLMLTPQIINPPNGGGSVADVTIRAMHDGEWLAIQLEWTDAAPDRVVGVNAFRDAAAVGFPLGQTEPPPSPFMGDVNNPIAIWQWTADLEAEALGRGGFAERYPHTEGVWYFPQDAAVRREVRSWRGTDPVVEFVAKGFGTLTRRPTHNVFAASAHEQGRWRVTFRRRLETGDPEDPGFKPGEATRLVAAVWNGSHSEVNGRKSVTINWTPFELASTLETDVGSR